MISSARDGIADTGGTFAEDFAVLDLSESGRLLIFF